MVFPKKTGIITALRRGELMDKVATEGLKYSAVSMVLPELYAYCDVSVQDLEDSGFNLESELMSEFGEAFGYKIGYEFINGSGADTMEGILTNADIGSVKSKAAADLAADTLMDFFEASLKTQYRVGARALFRLTTLAKLRQLKDSSGRYIWLPAGQGAGSQLTGAAPSTICGVPYTICEDVPAIANNAYPIIYGNFKQGYLVGLRVAMSTQRIIDSSLDAQGLVRFSSRARTGGKVVNPNAIKKYCTKA